MEHESVGDNKNRCAEYNHQRIGTKIRGLGNKRTSGDHTNNSIVEIGQNTKKTRGDGETSSHSDSSGKLSTNAGIKNSTVENTNSTDWWGEIYKLCAISQRINGMLQGNKRNKRTIIH